MVTTISGSNITFTDGSTWAGATPGVVPDTNSSNTATSYNVGYLAFGNTVFVANLGYSSYYLPGNIYCGLNNTTVWKSGIGATTLVVGVNNSYPATAQDFGSQCFYMAGTVNASAAGTWRFRGQAVAKGINQDKGNFALAERVA
jgi:hypothetical protein